MEDFVTPELRACIDDCLECADMCSETMQHCLSLGGKHAEKGHIALLQSCADLCFVGARAMLTGSPAHSRICAACAAVCDTCADGCEAMVEDFMQECAAVCRACADSCHKMAGESPVRQTA